MFIFLIGISSSFSTVCWKHFFLINIPYKTFEYLHMFLYCCSHKLWQIQWLTTQLYYLKFCRSEIWHGSLGVKPRCGTVSSLDVVAENGLPYLYYFLELILWLMAPVAGWIVSHRKIHGRCILDAYESSFIWKETLQK
jgi:hypothetical protein